MDFGGDSVEIGKRTAGTKGQWNIPEENVAWVTVSGVRFRPLRSYEKVQLYDKAVEPWKLTAPPVAAVMAANANDLVRHNNRIYEIDGGIEPFTDASGALFKVTVMCKRQQVETG